MSKEPGPREKALREMREARHEGGRRYRQEQRNKNRGTNEMLAELKDSPAEAAKKTGKGQKKK